MSKQGGCFRFRFWSALILIFLLPFFLLTSQSLIMPEECHEVAPYRRSSMAYSVKKDDKFARILTECVDKAYTVYRKVGSFENILSPEVRAVFYSIQEKATESHGFWGRIEMFFISAYFIEMVDLYDRAVKLKKHNVLCKEELEQLLVDKIDSFHQEHIRAGICVSGSCDKMVDELHNYISVLRGLVRGCPRDYDKASSLKMLVLAFTVAAIFLGLGLLLPRLLFSRSVFVVGMVSRLSVAIAVAVVAIGSYQYLNNISDSLVNDLDVLSKGIHEYRQFLNFGSLPPDPGQRPTNLTLLFFCTLPLICVISLCHSCIHIARQVRNKLPRQWVEKIEAWYEELRRSF